MYTRKGDSGETSLFGPRRVGKDSPRVQAYGEVDELNSFLGVVVSGCRDARLSAELRSVQRTLFVAGADLATELAGSSRVRRIAAKDVAKLERLTDRLLEGLPTLRTFILPGGSRTAAELHFARALCRRAERSIVAASRTEGLNPQLVPYFNRLSSYLFNLARAANRAAGKKERAWSGSS